MGPPDRGQLTADIIGVRACLDDLRATEGSVFLVSSVHALMGLPGHPAYAATKAGHDLVPERR
jgi:NAD(P)-dependent dehydrogenase (short-subunit alcohol dehydrogenase family)